MLSVRWGDWEAEGKDKLGCLDLHRVRESRQVLCGVCWWVLIHMYLLRGICGQLWTLWCAQFLSVWVKKNMNTWKAKACAGVEKPALLQRNSCASNYPSSPIGGISTPTALARSLSAWEEIFVCLCTANTGSVVQRQFLILMISWIHSLLYLREGRSDPLENSDNCFYLIFIKPHSRIIWWLFLLHCSSLWHF